MTADVAAGILKVTTGDVRAHKDKGHTNIITYKKRLRNTKPTKLGGKGHAAIAKTSPNLHRRATFGPYPGSLTKSRNLLTVSFIVLVSPLQQNSHSITNCPSFPKTWPISSNIGNVSFVHSFDPSAHFPVHSDSPQGLRRITKRFPRASTARKTE